MEMRLEEMVNGIGGKPGKSGKNWCWEFKFVSFSACFLVYVLPK